jgi:hypothetical protein
MSAPTSFPEPVRRGDTSNCGARTVVLDGASVKSGTLLAAQADGGEVTSACATSARARYDRPHVDHRCKPFFGFTRQPLIGVVRASAADALTQPSAMRGALEGRLPDSPNSAAAPDRRPGAFWRCPQNSAQAGGS